MGELSVSVKSEAVEALLLSLAGDPGWSSQDSDRYRVTQDRWPMTGEL